MLASSCRNNYITIQAVTAGNHSLQTDTLYKKKEEPTDTEYNTRRDAMDPALYVRNVPPSGSSVNSIAEPTQEGKLEARLPTYAKYRI